MGPPAVLDPVFPVIKVISLFARDAEQSRWLRCMVREGVTDLLFSNPRRAYSPDIALYSIEVVVWLMFVDSAQGSGLAQCVKGLWVLLWDHTPLQSHTRPLSSSLPSFISILHNARQLWLRHDSSRRGRGVRFRRVSWQSRTL